MIRTFLFLILAVMFSCNVYACETYVVDWPTLKSAVDAFIETPGAAEAHKIDQLLPAGKCASAKSGDSDYETKMGILSNIETIDKMIIGGNPEAVKVAYALHEISDGEYSEWLTAIIGDAAASHPREFLIGVKERNSQQSSPCFAAVLLRWDNYQNHTSILKKRLDAIQTVTDPELADVKACTVKLLKEYMDKPPMY